MLSYISKIKRGSNASLISTLDEPEDQLKILNQHVQNVKSSLIFFQEVLRKKKLEILSENGSIVLESTFKLNEELKKLKLIETNSSINPATSQMHMMLSELITICDQVALSDDATTCTGWNEEKVHAVVDSTLSALEKLFKVATQQLNKSQSTDNTNRSGLTKCPEIVITNTEESSQTEGKSSKREKSSTAGQVRTTKSVGSLLPEYKEQSKPKRHTDPLVLGKGVSLPNNTSVSMTSNEDMSRDLNESLESVDLSQSDINSETISEGEDGEKLKSNTLHPVSMISDDGRSSNESLFDNDNSQPQSPEEHTSEPNIEDASDEVGVRHIAKKVSPGQRVTLSPTENTIETYMHLIFDNNTHTSCQNTLNPKHTGFFSISPRASFDVDSDIVFSNRSSASSSCSSIMQKPKETSTNEDDRATSCENFSENNRENANESEDGDFWPEPATNLLDKKNVSKYLIKKLKDEKCREVKGGPVDALIVNATKPSKYSDEAMDFRAAFLTTFRTFIQPAKLIEKLIYRYQKMAHQHINGAKETFYLLLDVVKDLRAHDDITYDLLEDLFSFSRNLIVAGQLGRAKDLRDQILEKVGVYKSKFSPMEPISSRAVTINKPDFLQLPSIGLARQMTLLDMDMFHSIHPSEMLYFVKSSKDRNAPNLKRFTEHFNKKSFWARSQILLNDNHKIREKYMLKFIRTMEHLRAFHNFNSFLALLSALESTEIMRLQWPKKVTDALHNYGKIIVSDRRFGNYRKALIEAQPPCIPYIGMILSDLTLIHTINNDLMPDNDNAINFTKRWLQYDIILNMKRFKYKKYNFKFNEQINLFFDNFDDYLDEEVLWDRSQKLKPSKENNKN